MKRGVEVFSEEQQRQSDHGFTPEHDDRHSKGELIEAALCYTLVNLMLEKGHSMDEITAFITSSWPFELSWWKPSTNPQENLRKAGGLLASEYDRLSRTAVVV
jgi:hypothetical protein